MLTRPRFAGVLHWKKCGEGDVPLYAILVESVEDIQVRSFNNRLDTQPTRIFEQAGVNFVREHKRSSIHTQKRWTRFLWVDLRLLWLLQVDICKAVGILRYLLCLDWRQIMFSVRCPDFYTR